MRRGKGAEINLPHSEGLCHCVQICFFEWFQVLLKKFVSNFSIKCINMVNQEYIQK